jgi:hypothetical protein
MSTEHHKHGQIAGGVPSHGDVSFEVQDVRPTPIIKFLIYLGVTVVFSYVLTYGVYKGLIHYWRSTYTPPVPSWQAGPQYPPEPRLQGMPGHLDDAQLDMREKVKADTAANNELKWLDEKAGIAQIPVKDAMQLIVEKGLPSTTAAPAEKK